MQLRSSGWDTESRGLWSRNFIILLAISFLAYANFSVFFQYFKYLRTLPIDTGQYGLLMGAFSAVALIVRPIISPLLHEGNAKPFLYLGTAMVIVTLAAYSFASGFWSMLVVRIFHGLSFVVMGTALMALFVGYIPQSRSSQAFGLLSIIVILPNTTIPPLWPVLDKLCGGFTNVLLAFAGLTVLVYLLVSRVDPADATRNKTSTKQRLTGAEIKQNMLDPRILIMLSAMLMLYCGYALIFFFIAGFAKKIGLAGVGFFFTLTTIGEIGVRITAKDRFDRTNKGYLIAATMFSLAVWYFLLPMVRSEWLFYILGLLLGLGWGVAMPVFNGLLFDLSDPKFRALNTNLGFQMFQGGFFIGPFLGGLILDTWEFRQLFYLCTASSIVGACLSYYIGYIHNRVKV